MSLRSVARLLAAMDRQLHVEAMPLGADLDAEIDRNLALDEEDRIWTVRQFESILKRLQPVPYTLSGNLAAFLQGVPAPVRRVDAIIAEPGLDALAEMIANSFCVRWNPRWEDWDGVPTDPRGPGQVGPIRRARWGVTCQVARQLVVLGPLAQVGRRRVRARSNRLRGVCRESTNSTTSTR